MTAQVQGAPVTVAEKAIRTTLRYADTLLSNQGENDRDHDYTIAPTDRTGIFALTTPERIDRKTGECYTITYTVDVIGKTCNCKQFELRGICKHQVAAERKIEEVRQQLREAQALLTPSAEAPGQPRGYRQYTEPLDTRSL